MDNLNLTTNGLIGAGEAAGYLAAFAAVRTFRKTHDVRASATNMVGRSPSGWGTWGGGGGPRR